MYETVAPYLSFWMAGLLVTLGIAAVVFPAAIAIGLVVAFGRLSDRPLRRWIAKSFLTVFRGLPELLVIFTVFYGSSIVVQHVKDVSGIDLPDLDPFFAATLALALQFGAYAAVVFCDWLRIFPRGLIEAGQAVGMTSGRICWRIVLPILLRQATPSLGNLFLVLLKISALASLIGVNELNRRTTIVAGSTRDPLLCYTLAAVLYLLVTAFAGSVQSWIEGREHGVRGH